jgi:hypothetical protein
MGEGVVADFVPSASTPLHQARIGFRIAADDEEGGRHMLGAQNVENLRRPFRIGTVVEGQRDLRCGLAPNCRIT